MQCIRKGAQGTTDRRPERDDEEGGGERESRGAGGIRGANELRGRGTSAEGSEEAKNQYKSCRRPGVALFDEERRWVVRCLRGIEFGHRTQRYGGVGWGVFVSCSFYISEERGLTKGVDHGGDGGGVC
ncbi:hypothetical protein Tco_0535978 [Tanacetum coccineum]